MSDEGPRIGVLACACWSRSQSGIDADAIVAGSLGLPHVVVAEATDDLCGSGHARLAGDLVRRHSLDRMVVAGCACCNQDQRCSACNDERAGLRDSVLSSTGLPWEHQAFVNVKDHAMGTDDSLTLVAMSIARLAATPETTSVRASKEPTRTALVIGAGVIGRRAAVELGERGIPTHLVDRSSPAGTVAAGPKNVDLHVPARVISVSGGAGEFTVTLSELGGVKQLTVGALVVAPGLAEERREVGVGWGLPHQTMEEPPRRVSGAFLAAVDGLAAAGAVAAFLGRSIRGAQAVVRVDTDACIGCLKCVRVCPYSAISKRSFSMDVGSSSWTDHVASVDPFLCAGCGACTSACLNWAIEQAGYSTRELEAAIQASGEGPHALMVVCNWSAYRAVDHATKEGILPPGLALIRLPCLARLSPHLVQVALDAGTDPLIVAGCSEGGCHYRGRRAMTEEHMRNMEAGLAASGDLERVFVLALGPTDRDVLATRVQEALAERRYVRGDSGDVTHPTADMKGGWG